MDHRRAGVTLVELVMVLVLIGILISLAVPSMTRMVSRARTTSALNQLATDVAYARMLALREGAGTEFVFVNRGTCPPVVRGRFSADGYQIDVRGTQARLLRQTDLRSGAGTCLESNGDAKMAFSSRGLLLPFENRTVWARQGTVLDSLSISVLGRVYRRF